jgi:hypothetical protein
LETVRKNNFISGLHKACSESSINEELCLADLEPYNRYHFLNFLSHTSWKDISDSKLEFDCSLGFAERYGFRNSYGKAFQPFDCDNNVPFDFVEAPLHFMDTTFNKYMKIPTSDISKIIIDFFEKNSTNCDFSLLWHNTYFTNYKYNSYLPQYKNILKYMYDNKVACVSPKELITENKLVW